MNAIEESLSKARHDSGFLLADLQDANRHATPLESLILLPIIADVRAASDRLNALIDARGGK